MARARARARRVARARARRQRGAAPTRRSARRRAIDRRPAAAATVELTLSRGGHLLLGLPPRQLERTLQRERWPAHAVQMQIALLVPAGRMAHQSGGAKKLEEGFRACLAK